MDYLTIIRGTFTTFSVISGIIEPASNSTRQTRVTFVGYVIVPHDRNYVVIAAVEHIRLFYPGTPNGKFWENTLKQQQSMNKAFWNHFKHFGWLFGENLSVPHSHQDRWKSCQQSKCTYNPQPDLLGSFPADVCPDIKGQFGCSHKGKFRPSVGGGGGEGEGSTKWVWPKGETHPLQWGGDVFEKKKKKHQHIPAILDTRSPQASWMSISQ